MFRRNPSGLRVGCARTASSDAAVDAAPGFRVGISYIDRESEGVLPMGVAAMNHFTVLSDDLEATRRFY